MRILITLFLTAALLVGCAPWLPVQNINVGMTKAEVLQQLGKPTDVAGTVWPAPAMSNISGTIPSTASGSVITCA